MTIACSKSFILPPAISQENGRENGLTGTLYECSLPYIMKAGSLNRRQNSSTYFRLHQGQAATPFSALRQKILDCGFNKCYIADSLFKVILYQIKNPYFREYTKYEILPNNILCNNHYV